MIDKPTRTMMRYLGGKWRLANWIISHFPSHQLYVEPYGGAASVLLQKPRSHAEVYNDLDDEIVNVFRVMRDPGKASELMRLLLLTPYARAEFKATMEKSDDPVEQARRTIARSFMGFSSDSATRKRDTGFRTLGTRRNWPSSLTWQNYPFEIQLFCDRLQGVVIENIPALKVFENYDNEETLFYVDPPYVHATRHDSRQYCYEMSDDDHIELLEQLSAIKGMVIISGFRNNIYDKRLKNWTRVERNALGQTGKTGGSKVNTECLWIKPNTVVNISLEFPEL